MEIELAREIRGMGMFKYDVYQHNYQSTPLVRLLNIRSIRKPLKGDVHC